MSWYFISIKPKTMWNNISSSFSLSSSVFFILLPFRIEPGQLVLCFSLRNNISRFPALPSPRFLSLSLFHPPSHSLWHLTSSFAYHRLPSSSSLLPRLWLHLSSAAAAAAAASPLPPRPHPLHNSVRRLHSRHVPTKGYMAHFLISCIVGYLGSQACLLESYLYPPSSPPPSVDCWEDNLCRPCFFFSFFL